MYGDKLDYIYTRNMHIYRQIYIYIHIHIHNNNNNNSNSNKMNNRIRIKRARSNSVGIGTSGLTYIQEILLYFKNYVMDVNNVSHKYHSLDVLDEILNGISLLVGFYVYMHTYMHIHIHRYIDT